MDYISLMVLAMQTQFKKNTTKKANKKKISQVHCCLLFSLLDDLSGTLLGFSNSKCSKTSDLVGLGYGKIQVWKTAQ